MSTERIPGYAILGRVGAGGMGEVWKARRLGDGSLVAVKLLPAALHDDPTTRGLFLREAILLSTLRHANVCRLLDSGETESGRFFFITELVHGRTVAQALMRGPLPVREALDVAAQTARALEAAHERSIVHRDIKPANIMLAGAAVKVLDFGVAHLLPADDVGRVGTIFGTPAYAAPEHLAGGLCDHRADLWSLGVVLWEMVTGQAPFATGDPARVAHRILAGRPPRFAELFEGCREGGPFFALDAILRQTLTAAPDDRFATATAAAAALEEARREQADEPLLPRRTPADRMPRRGGPPGRGLRERLLRWLRSR